MRVRGDTLFVSAPLFAPKKTIEEFLNQKRDWIIKQLAKNEASHMNVSEKIYYKGKPYSFIVKKGKTKMEVFSDQIVISQPQGDKEAALSYFYHHGKKDLDRFCSIKIIEYLNMIGYRKDIELQYHILKRSLGICYPDKRRIVISLKLIHYDQEQLEAVLWHEVCHLVYRDHSKKFYKLVESRMPDYRKRMKEIV